MKTNTNDNYSKFTSESGHWYTQEGDPMYTIVGANGVERNTTLRDAKALGLVPSVTTIIGMIAKPFLENWKIDQALKSAIALEKDEDESDEEFFYRCKQDSKKIGLEAAKSGTKIHAQIEKGFLGKSKNKTYKVIQDFLDETFPKEEWIAEDSFCAPQGYGGKIDLYSKSGIFIDFNAMQLSAYAQGCKYDEPERVSIFVDREDPKFISCHIWDKDTHLKHLSMFNSILTYWKLVKNYDPTKL